MIFTLSGKPYLAPTAMRSGGTLLPGIVENVPDAITFRCPADVDYCRVGLWDKGGLESRAGRQGPAILMLPIQDASDRSAVLKTVLFSHLTTTGTLMRPTGGTSTMAGGPLPTFAMVVRPTEAGALHLYSPRWRLATDNEINVQWGQAVSHLQGNFLMLVAGGIDTGATPPWMLADYASINTAYSLTEPS